MNQRPRASAGMTQGINRQLRSHPILMPLVLLALGVGLFLASQWFTLSVSSSKHVRYSVWVLVMTYGLGAIFFVLGLFMLPIGLGLAFKRSRNRVPLQCPACGLIAANSQTPFRVNRVPGVDYVMVTCPRCRYDFTADRYARLS